MYTAKFYPHKLLTAQTMLHIMLILGSIFLVSIPIICCVLSLILSLSTHLPSDNVRPWTCQIELDDFTLMQYVHVGNRYLIFIITHAF